MDPIHRLIYASRSQGFAMTHAVAIRRTAERFNGKVGITGALVATRQRFLQVLEGPQTTVQALYTRIQRDPRHESCVLLLQSAADFRLWPDWSMKLLGDLQFERRAAERGLQVDALPDDPTHALQWIELLYSFSGDGHDDAR
ncbi:MAG: BLUF domain-containing protein [Xanthomonadales bacterium]|jgi:hypothetical protein|nr:BLUF domain-containing protein [Xanthomonadales bacterium]